MHPLLISLGRIPIHWYGVCVATAFLSFMFLLRYLARGTGRDVNYISNLLMILVVSAAIGARAAYVIEHWSWYAGNPADIIRFGQGGLMFFGGFILASLAVFTFARYHKERTLDFLDWLVTPLPLAHAIGRVGCFLEGCCFGARCEADSVWAVTYPEGSHAGHSLPVYPSQLFEAAGNFLIFVILMLAWRRRKLEGQQVVIYCILYAVLRFFIEDLRSDERATLGPFTISQAISLALLAFGLGLNTVLWRKKERRAKKEE